MKKQTELHHLIMSLQMDQITSLKHWMTRTEDGISRLQPLTADSLAAAKGQLQEALEFQAGLETQHAAVSSISNFIVVDTEDSDSIEDQLAGSQWHGWKVEYACITGYMKKKYCILAIYFTVN